MAWFKKHGFGHIPRTTYFFFSSWSQVSQQLRVDLYSSTSTRQAILCFWPMTNIYRALLLRNWRTKDNKSIVDAKEEVGACWNFILVRWQGFFRCSGLCLENGWIFDSELYLSLCWVRSSVSVRCAECPSLVPRSHFTNFCCLGTEVRPKNKVWIVYEKIWKTIFLVTSYSVKLKQRAPKIHGGLAEPRWTGLPCNFSAPGPRWLTHFWQR